MSIDQMKTMTCMYMYYCLSSVIKYAFRSETKAKQVQQVKSFLQGYEYSMLILQICQNQLFQMVFAQMPQLPTFAFYEL